MIQVFIPNNNTAEREYIINILLGEYLGLTYEVLTDPNQRNWIIVLESGKRILFKDSFFNNFQEPLAYLDLENLPKTVLKGNNAFLSEPDIPILYGEDVLEITDNGDIYTAIDIFASSFFMLTRWEELVNKKRDAFNRFLGEYSIAHQFDFVDRPIVNEYTEFLWAMMVDLGISQVRAPRSFEMMVTHDVDLISKYSTWLSGLREIVVSLIKKKDLKLAKHNLLIKFKALLKISKDPFDTFDWLMDISDKYGRKSHFFFMATGQTEFDNLYRIDDPFVKDLKRKIIERGHKIGIHPSYNSYDNCQLLKAEKQEIVSALKTETNCGRQHCLRFSIPETWQAWEENEMLWDSTLGYADMEGFRGGTCYPFSVFNVLTRTQLKLKEYPLILMEVTLHKYRTLNPHEFLKRAIFLRGIVEKYKGVFVILWHNNNFNEYPYLPYKNVYEQILS